MRTTLTLDEDLVELTRSCVLSVKAVIARSTCDEAIQDNRTFYPAATLDCRATKRRLAMTRVNVNGDSYYLLSSS